MRMTLAAAVFLLSGCALFFSGSAKVVSQTSTSGVVEMTGNFDPDDSEAKAHALIKKHCGADNYTSKYIEGNQIEYSCGAQQPADNSPSVPASDCVPNGGHVKNLEHIRCCSGYAKDELYNELDVCS
jgi:hypothetical protein